MSIIENKSKIVSFVTQVLLGKNLDSDTNSWEDSQEFNNFVFSSDKITILSLDCVGEQKESQDFYLIKILEDISIDNIVDSIDKYLKLRPFKSKSINILWLINSLKNKLYLKKELNNIIKKLKIKKGINSALCILKEDIDECIEIKNVNRYEMLIMPPIEIDYEIKKNNSDQNSYPFKGYVCSVKLYDLVNIYNIVGDAIFKDNLRFGISEQLGVDNAIQDTLKNQSSYFWFRNNGVTIIIDEPDKILESTNSILLQPKGSAKLRFSVVNGAQTITAAAHFYYELETEILRKEDKKRAIEKSQGANKEVQDKILKLTNEINTAKNTLSLAKKAEVILRIIQFQQKGNHDEIKKISIALNRQKPIKMEDIAFTNTFIDKLNRFLIDNEKGYCLCKRSEISYSENEISIVDFVRARKALSGDPGKARSSSSNSLLKIKNDKFVDEAIFIKAWYEADETQQEIIFKKYYNAVEFAIKLSKMYEGSYTNIKVEDDYIKTVIENGKWYFVAFLILVLNRNDEDYSNFDLNLKQISQIDLNNLIEYFAKYFKSCFDNDKNEKINSNTFKNSDKYKILKESNYSSSEFFKQLSVIFNIDTNTSSIKFLHKIQKETDMVAES